MSAGVDVTLEEALEQKPMSSALLSRLLACARPYRGIVIVNMIGTALAVASQIFGPKLIQLGIDKFLTHITSLSAATHGIMIISGLYLGNLLLGWGLTVLQVKSAIRVGQSMMSDLRLAVFQHIQALSLSYFDKTHQGRIITRADADIDAMEQVLTWGVNQLLASALTLIGVLFVLTRYDWRLCLAVGSVLPPLAIATYFFQKLIMHAHRQVRMQSSRLLASLAENISGVRVVQAMGRESENLERFEDLNQVYMDRAYTSARIFHTFMPLLGLVSAIGTAIVLGYGGTLVLRHEISVGDMFAFVMYVGMFFGPSKPWAISTTIFFPPGRARNGFFNCSIPSRRWRTGRARASCPRSTARCALKGSISVMRRRQRTAGVLDNVDFLAEAGQTVALVGHTGSGKTSIISLLARFYEPQQGRVLIDGHDVALTTIQSLHRQLGIVTQENFLFTGSVIDNLRFGRPEATDEEVRAAAEAVGTHAMIEKMKDGYATSVGERGGNLSAGERQLLCITRALVARPRILILDEATSAVDPTSEALIQSALEILLKGRTTFVIAHRLSTVRKASLILVLQQGKIVERGTHESLLTAGGVYAGLHDEFARH